MSDPQAHACGSSCYSVGNAAPRVRIRRGGRLCPPKQREALSFRASARREASALGVHTGVGIRLPSPPSEREVSARSADGGRDAPRFSLPQSAAPTAPSPRGPPSAALPRCRDAENAAPYTRFNIPSRRAGPACPAAGYAFFGGTHGSRPTEKTDSRKNNAAPLAGRRAFRPCIAQTEEGYIRRFYKREPRGIPPKGRKGANLPGNAIPRVFYFPIIYFQRKYASTAFPTVTSRQSKGTRRTCAL